MKSNHFACAIALLVSLLFSQCDQRPYPIKGDIPLDSANAKKHLITVEEAEILMKNFKETRDTLRTILIRSAKVNLDTIFRMPSAESFNRDAIALLLNQKDCQGIRIYYGKDDNDTARFVLAPIDSKGRDIPIVLDQGDASVNIPGIAPARAGGRQVKKYYEERGNQCEPTPCLN